VADDFCTNYIGNGCDYGVMTIHDEHINLNILIIEDNPGDYQLILDNLEEKFKALNVSYAKNARDAEALLLDERNTFNAILFDLYLPDKGGKELIEYIVSLSGNTPVIILSGFSDIRFSIQSLSMGIVDFLNKDEISPALLQKSILYSIERNQASKKLQESEKHYRKLFQLSPEPMFVLQVFRRRFSCR
jgi:DNA-binding NtrC family response regulator